MSLNIYGLSALSTALLDYSLVGHISFKNTALPFESVPTGVVSKSILTVPARAYATTNGGDAR